MKPEERSKLPASFSNSGHGAHRIQWPVLAWGIIVVLLLVRLAVAPWVVLIPEEAYYWMYAKHPALGYLDHPPMVAWVIGAGARLLGDTELGVRLGTWLLTVGSTLLCYRLAAEWCGRRAGCAAALLFSIAPLYFAAGFLAMPDAPLVFFWLTALVAITRANRRNAPGWWLVAGAATGFAFLAKYPAAFLALGTLLFLLSDARGRAMLRGSASRFSSHHPYSGGTHSMIGRRSDSNSAAVPISTPA